MFNSRWATDASRWGSAQTCWTSSQQGPYADDWTTAWASVETGNHHCGPSHLDEQNDDLQRSPCENSKQRYLAKSCEEQKYYFRKHCERTSSHPPTVLCVCARFIQKYHFKISALSPKLKDPFPGPSYCSVIETYTRSLKIFMAHQSELCLGVVSS